MNKGYLMKDLKLLRDFGILGLILIGLLGFCEVYFTVHLLPTSESMLLSNGVLFFLVIISGILFTIIILLSLVLFRNKKKNMIKKQNEGDMKYE